MFGFKKKNITSQIDYQAAYLEQLGKTKIAFNDREIKETNKRYKRWFSDKKKQEWRNQVAEWHPNIHTPEELTYATYIASAVGLVYDSVAANLTHIANAVYRGGFQHSFDKLSFEKELLEKYNDGVSMYELVLWVYGKTNEILEEIKAWDAYFADINEVLLVQESGKFQLESAKKVIIALYKFMDCPKEQHLKMEQNFCNREILLGLPNTIEGIFKGKQAASDNIGEMCMDRISKIGAGEQILISVDGWNQVLMNPCHVAFLWEQDFPYVKRA